MFVGENSFRAPCPNTVGCFGSVSQFPPSSLAAPQQRAAQALDAPSGKKTTSPGDLSSTLDNLTAEHGLGSDPA